MEAQTYLIKLVIVPIIYIVSVTECRYGNESWIRLEPNLDYIVGTSEARKNLSCSEYCKKALRSSLAFYFKVPKKDCLDYFQKGYTTDGVYELEPTSGNRITAWCDMKNGGGTIIHRRLDGSVDFYRNWTEYASGFGDTDGEYWVGLDNIHYLTQEPSELYIYMEAFENKHPADGYAWYSNFSVANSSLLYRLTLHGNGFEGNVRYCMSYLTGTNFTTFDRDNNDLSANNSAVKYHGAWWYKRQPKSHLTGQYLAGRHATQSVGVNWLDPWRLSYSLKTAIMKVRRV